MNALYWVYLEYGDNLIFMTFKMKKVQSKFEVVSTEFINWITFLNICNSDTCLQHVMLRASASNKMRMSGLSGQGKDKGSPDPFIRNKTKALIGLNLKF